MGTVLTRRSRCCSHETHGYSFRIITTSTHLKKMFLKALTNSKPTVGKDDLEQYERWTKTYGQEG